MSQAQVQYGAPSAQFNGEFKAPEYNGVKKTKLPYDPIPQGLQMCTIFGVVGLGTHMESYQNSIPAPKNKIMIVFEFPQFKRKFYEEDTELKSAAIMQEMVLYARSDKSKLRKIVEAACQRSLSDDEAGDFNFTTLIGASVVVNVQHYKKQDGSIGEKIASYNSIVGMPVPMGYQPENLPWLFFIDPAFNNFRTETFAKLPQFLRKKLIESQEGQTFISQGGIFAKVEQTQDQQQQQQYAQPAQAQQPVAQPQTNGQKVQMLVNDFTYQQYLSAGWTDETLVQNGKAKWIQQAAPAPTPTPGPSQTIAPAPVNGNATAIQQPAQQYAQPAQATPAPHQNIPSAAPVQQAVPTQNFTAQQPTPAQSWLEEEDDDMPF